MQFFVNHDDMFVELHKLFLDKTPNIQRLGTGEFTDSVIWESILDLSMILVPEFAKQNHTCLEIKTKSNNIEKLKGIKHNRKTITAWSLNTPMIIKLEERKTASLDARLKAAKMCQSWGYPLAFHFDPIVIYDGCEKDYEFVIKKLFNTIAAENVVWISLGTFRFPPALKPTIKKRFPNSKIIYGEFISGLDGKLRYFKPLRINIYKKIINYIKDYAPDVCLYFCMEDDDVWKKTLGFLPQQKESISKMLDHQVYKICDIKPVSEKDIE